MAPDELGDTVGLVIEASGNPAALAGGLDLLAHEGTLLVTSWYGTRVCSARVRTRPDGAMRPRRTVTCCGFWAYSARQGVSIVPGLCSSLIRAREDARDLAVYQFRKTPAGEPTVVQRIAGPLVRTLVRVLEIIDARVDKTPVNLPGGQQVQLADLPEAAVREAVVNALVHRDYRLGGPVRIEHAPTRLLVASPGPLVFGVTVGNILTTTSRPRNPALAKAVRILGLAEEAGVGVDRMYREMVRVGHQPPRYVEEPDQVAVTLLGGAPNRHVTRYVAALPEAEQDDADTLLILYHLLTHRVVSAVDAAPLLQKDVAETQEVLLRLGTEPVAMLEPTRETARRRAPNYRLRSSVLSALGPAVRYRRGQGDDAERKVVELVRAARPDQRTDGAGRSRPRRPGDVTTAQ